MAAGGAIGAEMTNRGDAGLHHPVSVAPRARGRDDGSIDLSWRCPGCSARAWARRLMQVCAKRSPRLLRARVGATRGSANWRHPVSDAGRTAEKLRYESRRGAAGNRARSRSLLIPYFWNET